MHISKVMANRNSTEILFLFCSIMKWFLIFYVVYLYRAPRLVATLLRLPPSSSSDDKESWISVSYFYKAFWSVFSAVVFGTLVTATISVARQVILRF